MERRTYLATALGAALTTAAGCIGDDDDDSGPDFDVPDAEVGATIAITSDGYQDPIVEISQDEAVEWVNETDNDRSVNSVTPSGVSEQPGNPWDFSGDMQGVGQGEGEDLAVRRRFDEPGYYWFYDDVQTRFQMCGIVVVDEDRDEVEDFDCRTDF